MELSADLHREVAQGLPEIDGLRFVSIAAVVIFHLGGFIQVVSGVPAEEIGKGGGTAERLTATGHYGVQLFFIISGYCIYMTATHCRSLALFWARRFSRLQPAFMAAILITFFIVSSFGLPDRGVDWVAAVANMAWLPAIRMTPPVDGVYWSLMVELKLYILFGLVYFGLRGRGDPVIWWTGLFLVGACIRTWDVQYNNAQIILSTYTMGTFAFPYSGFFMVGMLIYRWDSTPRWLKLIAVPAFAWACYAATTTWTERALLFALLPLSKFALDLKNLHVPKPLVFIGFISYPLYLLHNNVGLVVLRETALAIPSEYARIALACAVSLLLATLVSLTVEHRFRKLIERPIERVLALVLRLPSLLGSGSATSSRNAADAIATPDAAIEGKARSS